MLIFCRCSVSAGAVRIPAVVPLRTACAGRWASAVAVGCSTRSRREWGRKPIGHPLNVDAAGIVTYRLASAYHATSLMCSVLDPRHIGTATRPDCSAIGVVQRSPLSTAHGNQASAFATPRWIRNRCGSRLGLYTTRRSKPRVYVSDAGCPTQTRMSAPPNTP